MDCKVNGTKSPSFINALAYAKRKANREMYSFNEVVEDTTYQYHLNADEVEQLEIKLKKYCKNNYLYLSSVK